MVQRMRALYPHSFRFPVILSLALLSVLGRIDTARAQQGQDSLLISGSSVCSNNVCNFSSPDWRFAAINEPAGDEQRSLFELHGIPVIANLARGIHFFIKHARDGND